MKSEQEILDLFGSLVIKNVFDSNYRFVTNDTESLKKTQKFQNLFENMTLIQKKEIELYTRDVLIGCLFDFLRVFEENCDKFKIIYQDDNETIDLNSISEMLKAEPIIRNGWIERFSKLIDQPFDFTE